MRVTESSARTVHRVMDPGSLDDILWGLEKAREPVVSAVRIGDPDAESEGVLGSPIARRRPICFPSAVNLRTPRRIRGRIGGRIHGRIGGRPMMRPPREERMPRSEKVQGGRIDTQTRYLTRMFAFPRSSVCDSPSPLLSRNPSSARPLTRLSHAPHAMGLRSW
jgi:hypothetical protein